MTTTTAAQIRTATSFHGRFRLVTVTDQGVVFSSNGRVLLGDVEGMERVGWEFATIHTAAEAYATGVTRGHLLTATELDDLRALEQRLANAEPA